MVTRVLRSGHRRQRKNQDQSAAEWERLDWTLLVLKMAETVREDAGSHWKLKRQDTFSRRAFRRNTGGHCLGLSPDRPILSPGIDCMVICCHSRETTQGYTQPSPFPCLPHCCFHHMLKTTVLIYLGFRFLLNMFTISLKL